LTPLLEVVHFFRLLHTALCWPGSTYQKLAKPGLATFLLRGGGGGVDYKGATWDDYTKIASTGTAPSSNSVPEEGGNFSKAEFGFALETPSVTGFQPIKCLLQHAKCRSSPAYSACNCDDKKKNMENNTMYHHHHHQAGRNLFAQKRAAK
jgi:hypothetical protein